MRTENLLHQQPFLDHPCRNEATLWKRWEHIKLAKSLLLTQSGRNEATLWKRWERSNFIIWLFSMAPTRRNEATLWKRWELSLSLVTNNIWGMAVGMKPLSERDENAWLLHTYPFGVLLSCRNEATLWKRWELTEAIKSAIHTNPL